MEEKKDQILHDIKCLDLKEEVGGLTEEEWHQRVNLEDEFQRKVFQKEIKWKQRSRVWWLADGDKKH